MNTERNLLVECFLEAYTNISGEEIPQEFVEELEDIVFVVRRTEAFIMLEFKTLEPIKLDYTEEDFERIKDFYKIFTAK